MLPLLLRCTGTVQASARATCAFVSPGGALHQAGADDSTLLARLSLSSASECAYKQATPVAMISICKLHITEMGWGMATDSRQSLTIFTFPFRILMTPASKDWLSQWYRSSCSGAAPSSAQLHQAVLYLLASKSAL